MKKLLFEFEKFEVYQRALEFAYRIYKLTEEFPQTELFGLNSQLRRSAISVSLNIAEGFSKYHKKDKKRYYQIARGSVHECIPALTISSNQNYIEVY
jgi:four helix bundle protein